MIAYLEGRLREKNPTHIILLAGGVGYKLFIPLSTYYLLPEPGTDVSLRVHTHVREEILALYGFSSSMEEHLFQRLIGVAGVGPSLALKIMSGLEPEALVDAIRSGDLRRLGAIPGVGKKTAERLVVELRDKMPRIAEPGPGEPEPKTAASLPEDLLSALTNLGFARPVAERSVQDLLRAEPELEFEGALKKVLRKLSSG